MRITPRATLPADPRPALVAALSGRALAGAARRAGDRVVVLDLFADGDTRHMAESCIAIRAGRMGFDRDELVAAVTRLAPQVRGLVYGAGFEHDPPLLATLATLLPVLGNSAETVARVKDPLRFAALLARLGLPHPPTTRAPPPRGEGGWLRKIVGGSGGRHIAIGRQSEGVAESYFQRRVPGRPVAAAFVADGCNAEVLGYSEQWPDAAEHAPFRYGGCAGPVTPSSRLCGRITEACNAVVAAAGVVGLNSLDLLVDGDNFHVLEINPRPGATLDLFDGRAGQSLWRLHLDAVAGRLSARRSVMKGGVRAAAILYAPRDIAIPGAMAWPAWAADRGVAGTRIRSGEPICTLRASAPTVTAARAALDRRATRLLARFGGAGVRSP